MEPYIHSKGVAQEEDNAYSWHQSRMCAILNSYRFLWFYITAVRGLLSNDCHKTDFQLLGKFILTNSLKSFLVFSCINIIYYTYTTYSLLLVLAGHFFGLLKIKGSKQIMLYFVTLLSLNFCKKEISSHCRVSLFSFERQHLYHDTGTHGDVTVCHSSGSISK